MEIKLSKDLSRLTKKADPWDFANPPLDVVDLAESMVKFVLDRKALGVAYNQLDLPGNYAVFAMRGSPENFVCFNPKIVQPSEEIIELDEGCLSFPGMVASVKRPRFCRVRFSGPDGQVYTKTFTDMSARTFQHEMEHLTGIPFWSTISKLKFDMARKAAKKRGFDYSHILYKGIVN